MERGQLLLYSTALPDRPRGWDYEIRFSSEGSVWSSHRWEAAPALLQVLTSDWSARNSIPSHQRHLEFQCEVQHFYIGYPPPSWIEVSCAASLHLVFCHHLEIAALCLGPLPSWIAVLCLGCLLTAHQLRPGHSHLVPETLIWSVMWEAFTLGLLGGSKTD